jgi:hypothetical protein
LNRALRLVAQEIAEILVRDLEGSEKPEQPSEGVMEQLVQALPGEGTGQQEEKGHENSDCYRSLEARLHRVEEALAKLTSNTVPTAGRQDDQGSQAGSSFPNLKYAGHKYAGMDSVLKYVERDDEGGGVKLVIMNFND